MRDKKIYTFEDFRLDAASLLLYHNGEQVPLTPRAVKTLLVLIERRGEVVSKEQLMQAIWGETVVEESNLSQYLHILRKTLGKAHDGRSFIETLRRRGYRFSADVSLVREAPRAPLPVSLPVVVERKENIYSIADWQVDRRAEDSLVESEKVTSPFADNIGTRRWIYATAVLLGTMAVGAAAFAMYWPRAESASSNLGVELTIVQLTDGRDVNDATISADGDYFTYHETEGGVSRMLVQQVGQSIAVEIVPESTKTIVSKRFSPDGRFIYYIAVDKGSLVSSLYRVPTLGGVQTKLLDDLGSTVAVSPDGAQIAFSRSAVDATSTAIVIADSDGGNQRTILAAQNRHFWGGLAWSPDGRSIAFGDVDMKTPTATGKCTISAVEPETSNVRLLSKEKWDSCGRMEWSPDGKGLFFIGTRHGEGLTTRRDQLFYLSLETGEARRLTADGNRLQVSSLGVTSGGAALIVSFNRSSQLWTMDAGGKAETAVQITNGLADGRAGIAPLPDGRIGYTARFADASAIWTVNQDGTGARQISAEPTQLEELRASADGKHFYFSLQNEGKLRLMRSNVDGSDAMTVVDDDSFAVDSSLSPDGNWIAYDSAASAGEAAANTIRLVSTTGENFIQLTNRFSRTPNFSPDSRYVSFVGFTDELVLISIPDGNTVATFRALPNSILNIGARFTPDGKALAYIVKERTASNIWLQPLDGSGPKALTDFKSGEIYNFAFTADGQKIILARGYPIRNALLLQMQRQVPE